MRLSQCTTERQLLAWMEQNRPEMKPDTVREFARRWARDPQAALRWVRDVPGGGQRLAEEVFGRE